MSKLQLLQSGYTGFTGRLGTIQFANGISVSDVSPTDAAGLAALFTLQWVTAAGAEAAGSLTVASVPADGNTVVVNGVTYTWKTTPVASTDVAIGGTVAICASNLAAKLGASTNAALNVATYAAAGAVVNVTYGSAGVAGNAFTLTNGTSGSAVTVSGATLAGGVNPTVSAEDQTDPTNQFLGNGVDAVSAQVAAGVGQTAKQVLTAGVAAETPSTNQNANTATEGESSAGYAKNSPTQQAETAFVPTYTATINTVDQTGIHSSANPI